MRIGYSTDLHYRGAVPGTSPIAKRECRRVLGLLETCLADLSRRGVDLLICTGDLVDDPEHPAAPEDLAALRKVIEATGLPSILLPGNHDPAPEAFYRVFDRPTAVIQADGGQIVSFCDDVVEEGSLASTRADSALAQMRSSLGQPSPGWTLALQHYLIYPDRNEGYPHNYANAAAIRAIMEASPRALVSVSGHFHPGCEATRHNGVTYLCGGAFCEAPHPYYVIEIETAGASVQAFRLG